MNNTLLPQECTEEQEKELLLERVRAAINRGADSEALILAIRYNSLTHPAIKWSHYSHV